MLEKLKLQLFAESEENPEVAEPEETADDGEELISEKETEPAEQSATDPAPENQHEKEPEKQPQRDFERDSAYANMRRAMEETNRQNKMLAKTLQQLGFNGDTPEDIIDQANSHFLKKPVEEVRRQRLEVEKKQQVEIKKEAELEFYKSKEVERLMADDLAKIQRLDPTVKTLDDLGDDYLNLIRAGIDAEIAFNVLQQKKQKETKIPPADIGKVNSNSQKEKEFYTPEEVDKLTKNDLNNPKIMQRVMDSMTKWK